jgi:YVTN family beta-propeller protein
MRKMGYRLVAGVMALVSLAVHMRAQGSSFTGNDFSNWCEAMEELLTDSAKGRPPGFGYHWLVNVCVDNQLWEVTAFIVVGQNGNPTTDLETIPLGIPCKPSVDQNGNPLPNPGTTYSPQITDFTGEGNLQLSNGSAVRDLRSAAVKPAAASPANAFTLLLPYRDVPFAPSYAASLYPRPQHCDPSLNASVLIVNHDDAAVTRVTTCTGVQKVIGVGTHPLQVAATPDAATAVVTSFDGAVNFIDLGSNNVVGTLNLPNYSPSGVAISPDGTLAYVTSFDSATATLLVINIAHQSVVQKIPLKGYTQSVALTPDGTLAYVTDPIDGSIQVVDLFSATVSRTFSVPRPIGVAFNSTGTQAWVTTGNNSVNVLDTATYKTIQSIAVGAGPADVMITPEDSLAIVNSFVDQSITFINPQTFAIYGTVPLPGPPMGLAITE